MFTIHSVKNREKCEKEHLQNRVQRQEKQRLETHFLVSSMGLQKGWRDPGLHKNRGASIEISHAGAKTGPRSFQEEKHDIAMTTKP